MDLRLSIPLFCSFAVPRNRFDGVLWAAFPLFGHHSHVDLRFSSPSFRFNLELLPPLCLAFRRRQRQKEKKKNSTLQVSRHLVHLGLQLYASDGPDMSRV